MSGYRSLPRRLRRRILHPWISLAGLTEPTIPALIVLSWMMQWPLEVQIPLRICGGLMLLVLSMLSLFISWVVRAATRARPQTVAPRFACLMLCAALAGFGALACLVLGRIDLFGYSYLSVSAAVPLFWPRTRRRERPNALIVALISVAAAGAIPLHFPLAFAGAVLTSELARRYWRESIVSFVLAKPLESQFLRDAMKGCAVGAG